MMRALIVGDQAEQVSSLCARLIRNGFAVETASRADDALARASLAAPDVLLSALSLTVRDDCVLLRRWRTDHRLRSIPFVVYTGRNADPAGERLAREAGADAIHAWPSAGKALVEYLRTVATEGARATDTGPAAAGGSAERLEDVKRTLGEREKELRTLHAVAALLHHDEAPAAGVAAQVAALLPAAMQYPETTAARVRCGDVSAETPAFRESPYRLHVPFSTSGGARGAVDIVYLDPRPAADEGPFLHEERGLAASLAEMLRAYFERRHTREVLLKVGQAVAIPIGPLFFEQMTRLMVDTLGATGGVIGLLDPDHPRLVRTQVFVLRGERLDDVCYDVAGTPCEKIVGGERRVFDRGIRAAFPDDRMLEDLGLESYAGVPITDAAGRVVGLVSVFAEEPLVNGDLALSALGIFAARAAAELERQAATETLARTEAERRASEQRLREMAEHIGDIFYSYDVAADRLLYANRVYERIWGQPLQKVEARPTAYLDDVHPEDRVAAEAALARQLAGTVTDVEFRVVRPDGTMRWVHEHAVPIPGPGGQVARIVGTMRDITDRKQAEARILASEERFRLLAGVTTDAVWDWDLDRDHVWWNEGYETLFGHSREEADPSAGSWSAYLHPDDHDRVVDGIHRAIAGTAADWTDEYRFRHHAGHYLVVQDRGRILRDATGTATRMVGGMTDLTDRRRADQRLREQATLLDQARDAIMVRDLDHRVTYWNKGAERLYGWSAAEAIGRSVVDLIYRDRSEFDAAAAATLRDGEWVGEIEQVARNGRRIEIEGRWTLVRTDDGQPPSVLCINTDITERKAIEARLLRTQRMESIGTLAGGIAHDLNNVLAPVLLSLDLLRPMSDDPEHGELLDTLRSSVQRGADLVRQVLAFARGVEGRRIAVHPARVLRDVQVIVRDTFPKSIDFRGHVDPDLWAITGDPTQVHQVLMNLCVNARDAMPGGGRLTVHLENRTFDQAPEGVAGVEARPGSYVGIHVTDTGTGIPVGIQGRIFEPFFTTKSIGQGTGLGLSTSLAIVRSHGGFLHLASEPERGTTFSVFLPAQPTPPPAEAPVPGIASLPRGHNELVLVAEDDTGVRTMVQHILERSGYRVLAAANGSDALALYTRHPGAVDAVLTDMAMPGMDGPALIAALRAIRPSVRVIGSSGLGGNKAVARHEGVRFFIPKPYTVERLLRTLRDALTGD